MPMVDILCRKEPILSTPLEGIPPTPLCLLFVCFWGLRSVPPPAAEAMAKPSLLLQSAAMCSITDPEACDAVQLEIMCRAEEEPWHP